MKHNNRTESNLFIAEKYNYHIWALVVDVSGLPHPRWTCQFRSRFVIKHRIAILDDFQCQFLRLSLLHYYEASSVKYFLGSLAT